MKIRNILLICAITLFLNSCSTIDVAQRSDEAQVNQGQKPVVNRESSNVINNQQTIPNIQNIPNKPLDIVDQSQTPPNQTTTEATQNIEKPAVDQPDQTNQKLSVGVILPLTGKNSALGQSMLNSINMSLFDNDKNNNIQISIFDDKSNPYTAKKIIEDIAAKNIKLVIGPVFTDTVEAIAPTAMNNNISILSFSNNSALANKKGIFLSGFIPEQEIDRITSYMIDSGKNNFALIAPNNQYGIRIAQILRKSVESKDGNFISSQFYIDGTTDFSKTATTSVNSFMISKNMREYKNDIESIKDKSEREAKRVKVMNNSKIFPDTILLTEASNKVFDIVKEIQKANTDGRDIQIIGTSYWNKNEILANPILNEAKFPSPENQYFSKFRNKYYQTYQQEPNRINSIAYDITAFVIDLAKELKDNKPTSSNIINYNGKKGYNGIDGSFRFLPNGMIERNLAIIEINNGQFNTVEKGSKNFLNF